ncbi:MAG: YraN family protein [Marinobacterium sp.]|nr:YraN family protein [Marinobacterium sp.]
MDRQQIGKDAEHQAEHFLCQQGLKPVTRNFRSCYGEIDLIMMDGDELVFIEVRKRQWQQYGGAAESVDRSKRQKLIRTAQTYLLQLTNEPVCRFDVIAFEGKAASKTPLWYKDAFRI